LVTLDYAGPKKWLRVTIEFWSKGKRLEGDDGGESIHPPLSDVAAFGFADGSDSKGNPRVLVITSLPAKSTRGEGDGAARVNTTHEYGEPPSLKGRRIRTHTATFPLAIPDGKMELLWAVFGDEPEGAVEKASLEERAAKADFAWIFKVGTGDAKEK
jgi:hypothetical protein